MGIRRRARESALKMLYACEVGGEPVDWVIGRYWEDFEPLQEGREFADRLVRGTMANIERIDEAIKSISIHWRISRMACVDRNILRMAAYEIFFVKDIPRRVTLNEAIEIAKRYGTEDSRAFINGVLDKLGDEGK
jgi:transcription antitermination protein NusB